MSELCDWCGREFDRKHGLNIHKSQTHLDTAREIFLDRVNKGEPDECWEWEGVTDEQGYGHIGINGTKIPAHRVALMIKKGTKVELNALHKCDNKICVNPNHIYEGSYKDNAQDMMERGANNGGRVAVGQKGEGNHRSKLTTDEVLKIRDEYKQREVSFNELSKEYDVSSTTISDIVNRRKWKHV
jgi:hypothetical protein